MINTEHFLKRIEAGLNSSDVNYVDYIENETYINMRKFSTDGHEYQKYIVQLFEKDPGIDLAVTKCSQVGLSEILMRLALAVMGSVPGYAVGYLMPSIKFAVEVLRTRMAPIIEQSPVLHSLLNKKIDSGTVKMFNNMSILYALGASTTGKSQSLINRPLNLAIVDEIDRCDPNIASGMRSRQTHAGKYKPVISLSTPTYPDFGIDAEIKGRQLHQQAIICHSCKHEYLADYYEQVMLPGYDDPIRTLTQDKVNSKNLDVTRAFHCCPRCKTESILTPEHRVWVIENKNLKNIGVKLSPFDAPGFISAGDLVTSQLKYKTDSEFRNQSLGLPARKSDSALDITRVEFSHEETPSGGIRVSGMDLGKECHYLSGVATPQGVIYVDVAKIFTVSSVETDFVEEVVRSRVAQVVCDSLPLLDLVYKLSRHLPNFWPALYRVPAKPEPELYKLKVRDSLDVQENSRQVDIQKNVVFDLVADALMKGLIVFKHSQYDDLILKHLDSMRRVRDYKFLDERYKWVKAGGTSNKTQDHFFHTLLYLYIAAKIARTESFSHGIGSMVGLGSLMSKMSITRQL